MRTSATNSHSHHKWWPDDGRMNLCPWPSNPNRSISVTC